MHRCRHNPGAQAYDLNYSYRCNLSIATHTFFEYRVTDNTDLTTLTRVFTVDV